MLIAGIAAGILDDVNRPFDPRPLVLEGKHVRLEPLTLEHAEDLTRAGADSGLWRYLPIAPPTSLAKNESWIQQALSDADGGGQIPFAIVETGNGRAVGSTRYLDIQRENRSLEIGWTWIRKPWQRTAVNTECKFLLLRHAFEALGAVRIQLKTDGRNEQSQRAIARIGARREGVLRRNRRLWDGYIRDTVVFSILDSEWPEVKAGLEQRMAD